MFEHYKTFHPKPENTDGLKKVLQLIWNQPHWASEKGLKLVWKLGRTFRSSCFKINCLTMLNVEHCKWLSIFCVILKYGIEYCKSCNFWRDKMKIFRWNVQALLKHPFPINFWKFDVKFSISCREIAFSPVDHFSSYPVVLPSEEWATN